MTAQFQFFQSLPHKKADFVKKSRQNMGYYELIYKKLKPWIDRYELRDFTVEFSFVLIFLHWFKMVFG